MTTTAPAVIEWETIARVARAARAGMGRVRRVRAGWRLVERRFGGRGPAGLRETRAAVRLIVVRGLEGMGSPSRCEVGRQGVRLAGPGTGQRSR